MTLRQRIRDRIAFRQGWAPDGQVFVCPRCNGTSLREGYCGHDGVRMELRPRPRCPNGHYLTTIRYPLVERHCFECGAKTAD